MVKVRGCVCRRIPRRGWPVRKSRWVGRALRPCDHGCVTAPRKLSICRPRSRGRKLFPDEEGTETAQASAYAFPKTFGRKLFPDEEGTETEIRHCIEDIEEPSQV